MARVSMDLGLTPALLANKCPLLCSPSVSQSFKIPQILDNRYLKGNRSLHRDSPAWGKNFHNSNGDCGCPFGLCRDLHYLLYSNYCEYFHQEHCGDEVGHRFRFVGSTLGRKCLLPKKLKGKEEIDTPQPNQKTFSYHSPLLYNAMFYLYAFRHSHGATGFPPRHSPR